MSPPVDVIDPMCWQTPAPVVIVAFVSPGLAPLETVGVGDPSATRTVYATVVILVLLGLVLAGLAVWVLRRTVPEPELLAPLETMDTRSWRKLDPAAQRRALDESRPPGAVPLRREASEPVVDESFSSLAPVSSFEDLSDRGHHAPLAPSPDEELVASVEPDVVVAGDRSALGEEAGTTDAAEALVVTGESDRAVVAPVAQDEHAAEDAAEDDSLLTSKRSPSDRDPEV